MLLTHGHCTATPVVRHTLRQQDCDDPMLQACSLHSTQSMMHTASLDSVGYVAEHIHTKKATLIRLFMVNSDTRTSSPSKTHHNTFWVCLEFNKSREICKTHLRLPPCPMGVAQNQDERRFVARKYLPPFPLPLSPHEIITHAVYSSTIPHIARYVEIDTSRIAFQSHRKRNTFNRPSSPKTHT